MLSIKKMKHLTLFFARAYILEKISPGSLTDRLETGRNSFVFGGLPDNKAWSLIDELSSELIK